MDHFKWLIAHEMKKIIIRHNETTANKFKLKYHCGKIELWRIGVRAVLNNIFFSINFLRTLFIYNVFDKIPIVLTTFSILLAVESRILHFYFEEFKINAYRL